MKIFEILWLLFAMVSCLHQLKVNIKRKLRVWKAQKFDLLVSEKTAPTGTGQQTNPCHVAPFRASNEIFGILWLPLAMVPCLHIANFILKGKYGCGEPKNEIY